MTDEVPKTEPLEDKPVVDTQAFSPQPVTLKRMALFYAQRPGEAKISYNSAQDDPNSEAFVPLKARGELAQALFFKRAHDKKLKRQQMQTAVLDRPNPIRFEV